MSEGASHARNELHIVDRGLWLLLLVLVIHVKTTGLTIMKQA